jgi:hypothetical protein
MTMKSLISFCIWVGAIAILGSLLLSAFTPKAPEGTQKLIPVNQVNQVMALTATADKIKPHPTGTLIPPGGKSQPTAVPTPRNANVIQQFVMSLLAPSNANKAGANPAASSTVDSGTLVSLDQLVAQANGKNLDQLFAGASDDQKRMIQQYSGGKSSSEIVSNFCRDVKSDSYKSMSQSVLANASDPNTDPNSPALLILLFEKIASLCP